MNRRLAVTAALSLVALLVAVPAATTAAGPDTSQLRNAVKVDGVMAHEQALQNIANANGGTRASGTPGYAASVDYVADTLTDAGY
jgi:acid phosphatase class B